MNYKAKLQELRADANLSQSDIAEILGLARQTYNHYEIQENVIPLKYLNLLANYYNVSIDYILNLNDEKNYNITNQELDSKISGAILTNFRKENNITQEKLDNMLNTNKSVICNYEKGRNLIATPFLYEICNKYQISADYLLGRTDNPKYLKRN